MTTYFFRIKLRSVRAFVGDIKWHSSLMDIVFGVVSFSLPLPRSFHTWSAHFYSSLGLNKFEIEVSLNYTTVRYYAVRYYNREKRAVITRITINNSTRRNWTIVIIIRNNEYNIRSSVFYVSTCVCVYFKRLNKKKITFLGKSKSATRKQIFRVRCLFNRFADVSN